jgi:methyl-accepting chemotaxis protein
MGIDQVNQAITQMDEVTQQNAALVEEASAASQSMQEQAARLAELVGMFKLAGTTAGATVPAAPAAPAAPLRAPARPAARKTVQSLPAPARAAAPVTALRPRTDKGAGKVNARAAVPAGADEWEEF